MICRPCRDHRHHDCPGRSWCDCQHLGAPATPEQRADATDAADPADEPEPGATEPPVNWMRQG